MAAGCYEIIGLGANRVSVPHSSHPNFAVREGPLESLGWMVQIRPTGRRLIWILIPSGSNKIDALVRQWAQGDDMGTAGVAPARKLVH
jgi:hypothetical protein